MRLLARALYGIPLAHILVDSDQSRTLCDALAQRIDDVGNALITAPHMGSPNAQPSGLDSVFRVPLHALDVSTRLFGLQYATDHATLPWQSWEGSCSTFAYGVQDSTRVDEVSNVQPECGRESEGERFEKAAAIAQGFKQELDSLRRRLEQRGLTLPPSRFDSENAELMRFAFTTGLAVAESAAERQKAVELAEGRIADTIEWLEGQHFCTQADLQRWQHLLHWVDSEDVQYPVLSIEVGLATRECRGAELDAFGDAIISQVDLATRAKLSNKAGCPEQMVVIANCAGASALQGSYLFKLIKHIGLTLNRHYPHRLYQFYLLDLPRFLRWPVKAIISLGHPSTRQKILLCDSDDPSLPKPMKGQ